MAAGGYPGDYEKGKVIGGLDAVDEDCMVFHAGTKLDGEGNVVSAGGRVLGVAIKGDTHDEARSRAFENVKKISFEGMQYRNDIGLILKK